MGHHKRKRPKHQRSGCLFCKSYKDERVKGSKESTKASVRRRLQDPEIRRDHIMYDVLSARSEEIQAAWDNGESGSLWDSSGEGR